MASAISASAEWKPNARVQALHAGVAEVVPERVQELVQVVRDPAGQPDDRLQWAVESPLQPLDEQVDGVVEGELEEEPQVLLDQVGPGTAAC